jgi:hypothetical protein
LSYIVKFYLKKKKKKERKGGGKEEGKGREEAQAFTCLYSQVLRR